MNVNLVFLVLGILGLFEVGIRTLLVSFETGTKSKLVTIVMPIVNALGYCCLIFIGFTLPPTSIPTINKKEKIDSIINAPLPSLPIVDLPEEYMEITKDSAHPTLLLGYFKQDTLVIGFDPTGMDDD